MPWNATEDRYTYTIAEMLDIDRGENRESVYAREERIDFFVALKALRLKRDELTVVDYTKICAFLNNGALGEYLGRKNV